ncbi:MAG: hypothetical protein FJZ11_02175, partial [Candidatus Omnitrophica bacterium]|nr:hypothetical protein [Candidatus Omnitrophota bacterium]
MKKFWVFVFFAFFIGLGLSLFAEENQPVDIILDQFEKAPVQQDAEPQQKDSAAQVEISVSAQGDMTVIDTLELKNMDILDVLKLISKKSGLNIATGKNVQGKVTIFLKNVDVWDALKIILEVNDLAYAQEGEIVKVMTAKEYELSYGKRFTDKTQVKIVPLKYASAADLIPLLNQIKSVIGKVVADEKSNTIVIIDAPINLEDMQELIRHVDIPTVTEVFSLKFAKAEEIQKNISGVLTKNVGRIEIDNRTNKVVVTDTAANMEKISKMILAFDEKTPQVTIEAKILQVDLSDAFKMGIDWDKIFDTSDITLSGNFDVDTGTAGSSLTIGSANLSQYSYYALIEALNSVGKTNTLS